MLSLFRIIARNNYCPWTSLIAQTIGLIIIVVDLLLCHEEEARRIHFLHIHGIILLCIFIFHFHNLWLFTNRLLISIRIWSFLCRAFQFIRIVTFNCIIEAFVFQLFLILVSFSDFLVTSRGNHINFYFLLFLMDDAAADSSLFIDCINFLTVRISFIGFIGLILMKWAESLPWKLCEGLWSRNEIQLCFLESTLRSNNLIWISSCRFSFFGLLSLDSNDTSYGICSFNAAILKWLLLLINQIFLRWESFLFR